MNARALLGSVLAALALLFVLQNAGVVEIRFLIWSFAMSRSLLLLLVFALGGAAGWLLHGYALFRAKRR